MLETDNEMCFKTCGAHIHIYIHTHVRSINNGKSIMKNIFAF